MAEANMSKESWYASLGKALGGIVGRRQGGRPPVADDARDGTERRAEPRVSIDISASDGMRPVLTIGEAAFKIYDLSMRGMCVGLPPDGAAYEVGQAISASVQFSDMAVPVQLEVVNVRGRLMGCRITDAPMVWLLEVAQVIEPARIGRMLRQGELDADMRDPSDELAVSWFDGGPACDLLVWKRPDGTIERAQMTFMWHIVQWSRQHGLRSGQTDGPARVDAGGTLIDPRTHEMHSGDDTEAVAFARKILASSELEPAIRSVFDLPIGATAEAVVATPPQGPEAALPEVAAEQRHQSSPLVP